MSIASEITRINSNIAAAYTACSGKSATLPQAQNSANLATTINSISSGGGEIPTKKNVNFYDYDGSLLHGYTFQEVAQLSALPTLPTHTGLTAQGWTHTLSEIQAATQNINVGCYYATSDGKTHIHIKLKDSGVFEFGLIQSAPNAAVIDWGDGSPVETLSTASGTKNGRTRYKASHTYAAYPASYDISIEAVEGQWYGFGSSGQQSYGITHGDSTYGACIKRVFLAEGVSLKAGVFCFAGGMEYITGTATQHECFGLQYSFTYCYSLKYVIAYAGDENSFNQCRSLRTIVCRPDFSYISHTIYSHAFGNCISLEEIIIPDGVTTIAEYAFENITAATIIIIPSSVTTINYSAFNGTSRERCRLIEVNLTAFTNPSAIPILEYGLGSIFPYMNFTEGYVDFVVASSTMQTAFVNDTNWSSLGADLFVVR